MSDKEMVGWFTTSEGWKYVEFTEGVPTLARVYEPRKWWQWRKRLASASARAEVIKTLKAEQTGEVEQ